MAEDIEKTALNSGRLVRNVLLSRTPVDADNAWKELEANRAVNSQNLEKLRAVMGSDKGLDLLKTISARRADLVPKYERLHELNSTDKAKALDYLYDEFAPLNNAFISATEDLSKYQTERMAQADKESGELYASTRLLVIIVSIAAVSVAIGVGFVILRQLMRQLGGEPADVARVAAMVSAGDFSTQIFLRPGDDSSLFATLAKMQLDLQQRIQADRAAAAENARICTALDRATIGTMLTDNSGKIIYLNDAAKNIFRQYSIQIRAAVPQFDPERLLGTPIDALHHLPQELAAPHTAEVTYGEATLRIVANPVSAADGTRAGTVVQWLDRTLELKTEAELNSTVTKAIDGDLTARIDEGGKEGFFKTLSEGMNRLISNMSDVVQAMARAASEVSTGADEISRGNLNLSQRTEQQASSLEETASSMEQMTSAVKNNADNAAQASQLAVAARDQAERGGKVVGTAIAAMSEINVASKKIADIIGVIDDIAFQTNLLALNAAVEAARAGEQGRGFAVVASEVRNLASRSAGAAKEIKALIQDSVGKVSEGTKLVDESGKVLSEIVAGVKRVTDVVAEISASSREQASGIEQVNKAVTSMDVVTQQNAALVEEASAASQGLMEQAANLSRLISAYRVDSRGAASAVAPAVSVPDPVVKQRPPATERRAATRPWIGKTAAPAAPPAGTAAQAAAGGDQWTEF